MIRDLLDFTRARSDSFNITRAPADLTDLCRDVLDSMKTLHPNRTFHLTAAGDTRGDWDRDRIVRVISNLATNAVNYGGAESPITIAVTGDVEAVEVRVHNKGNPIAPEDFPQLFEPFTRGAGDTHAQGLGLGLFIVRQIVRAHGGQVEVASTPERGTTFTVRLPRR